MTPFLSLSPVASLRLSGASGIDSLTFTNNGAALTLGGGNSIDAGTGSDTINFNVGADVTVTGVRADHLGAPGIVSGGTTTLKVVSSTSTSWPT